jgi:hypothetical protein
VSRNQPALPDVSPPAPSAPVCLEKLRSFVFRKSSGQRAAQGV